MFALSEPTQKIIQDYLHLPFPDRDVNCPYFNNQRTKVRAALRVLVGKGTPIEIVEETQIIGLRDKIDVQKLSDDELKKFLVEHNLGIDCSALAYYILDAETRARGFGSLKKHVQFREAKTFVRKIIARFRPVENTSVITFASDANSREVSLAEIQPGDLIILWRTREDHALNHILIVTEIQGENIQYIHSFRWSKEGKYDHGVRQGTIKITNATKPIVDQIWEEKNKTGEENETLKHVKLAENVEIRRLKIFK